MGMRRLTREFRKNWKFFGVMILLAILAGVGTAFMSNGLNVLLDKASLEQKTLNQPETLTEAEKTELKNELKKAFPALNKPETLTEAEKTELKNELKKAFPNKASAQKYYNSLSQTEQENARKSFDSMSEEEKSKYR
jgi:preprotein translocase subunit SecF